MLPDQALHACKAAGQKPPVNVVPVAEGEEEIGSPNFPQVVPRPDVQAALGVQRWFGDEPWHDSLVRLVTQPTINIEGLVGGYTGPGGKTILPHHCMALSTVKVV